MKPAVSTEGQSEPTRVSACSHRSVVSGCSLAESSAWLPLTTGIYPRGGFRVLVMSEWRFRLTHFRVKMTQVRFLVTCSRSRSGDFSLNRIFLLSGRAGPGRAGPARAEPGRRGQGLVAPGGGGTLAPVGGMDLSNCCPRSGIGRLAVTQGRRLPFDAIALIPSSSVGRAADC